MIRIYHIRFIVFFTGIILISCGPDSQTAAVESLSESEKAQVIEAVTSEVKKERTYADIIASLQPLSPVLRKNKTINDFTFSAHYQPHLLLAVTNHGLTDLNAKTGSSFLKEIDSYKNLHYIKFTIRNNTFKSELLRYQLESVQQYSDRITYYSFQSQRDALIIENGKDTLRKVFVHFERTFDVSPELNLTFVFERANGKAIEDLKFVFDDKIFNNGKISFDFDYRTIAKLNAEEIKNLLL